MLSEDIKKYIHDLKSEFSSITEVWLIGSRANNNARDDSDWDFVVFSSSPVHEAIKNNSYFHREDIDLLIVNKVGDFTKPFGKPKDGSLHAWKWNQVSDELAYYEGIKWVPDEESAAEGIEGLGKMICQTLVARKV